MGSRVSSALYPRAASTAAVTATEALSLPAPAGLCRPRLASATLRVPSRTRSHFDSQQLPYGANTFRTHSVPTSTGHACTVSLLRKVRAGAEGHLSQVNGPAWGQALAWCSTSEGSAGSTLPRRCPGPHSVREQKPTATRSSRRRGSPPPRAGWGTSASVPQLLAPIGAHVTLIPSTPVSGLRRPPFFSWQ